MPETEIMDGADRRPILRPHSIKRRARSESGTPHMCFCLHVALIWNSLINYFLLLLFHYHHLFVLCHSRLLSLQLSSHAWCAQLSYLGLRFSNTCAGLVAYEDDSLSDHEDRNAAPSNDGASKSDVRALTASQGLLHFPPFSLSLLFRPGLPAKHAFCRCFRP